MSEPGNISASQVKSLLDVVRLLTVTADIDLLFGHIAEAVTSMLACDRASIFLHDGPSDELWTKVALQSGEIRVPASLGIVGHCFRRNEVINVPDAYADERFFRGPDQNTGFTKTLLTVPMLDLSGKPVGVVQALNRRQGTFDSDDEILLQLLADQAAVAFQRSRLQAAAIKAAGMEREVDLARGVQRALFPEVPVILPFAHADGWAQPASLTGGDCFDLWRTQDGRLGIFMGDAAGHGLAPALIISQVRTLVRALSDINPDPFQILSMVNHRLWHDLKRIKFVTGFLGFLAEDGRLQWFSAGHGPVLIRQALETPILLIDPTAPPLASEYELPGDGSLQTVLASGGMLTLTSDGIFEAFDSSRQQFSIQRIIQLMDALRGSPPHHLIAAVRSAVHTWQNADTPTDDQSIVVVSKT